MDFDALREKYRPGEIRILFIGESPAAGGDFFYRPGSLLCRYTREAFGLAFGLKEIGDDRFLKCFQALGCYLDDLCRIPVNRMDEAKRRILREQGVAPLSERLRRETPAAVISVMRAIHPYVGDAARRAGLAGVPLYVVPFPSRGNQPRYVKTLSGILLTLYAKSLLPEPQQTCKS